MSLIIDGHELADTDDWVLDFRHYLEFKPWRGARPRDAVIDLFTIHWTGGEGTADQVHQTLLRRLLGIELIIDRHGEIYQCCDPLKVSALSVGRGRRFNPRQLGVEIVNYGFTWPRWRRPPSLGRDRPTIRTKIKGMTLQIAEFYPVQLEAVLWLVDAITAAIPTIPRRVPRERSGELIHRTLTRPEALKFKGIVGHYHLSRIKIDPGPALMEIVAKHLQGEI